ncbi:hypothetical protein WICPIJ_002620 [Wickerhamomyces pijperi]|uniref:Uncharacterized protein n=1 Tax=Wickerhamomyces pijperi TaxID=599730 RepID=A0A9P8QBG3_WICPI|nr:hypothetical protein WICPIJ_002620 [Wickerhamomyces pijperi]
MRYKSALHKLFRQCRHLLNLNMEAIISVTVTVTTTTTAIASTVQDDPVSVSEWLPAVVSSTAVGDTSDWFIAVYDFMIWLVAAGWEISRTYWELILEIQGWIQHHPLVPKISAVLLSFWTTVQYICSSIVFTVRLLVYLVLSLYQVYLLFSPYIRWWISICYTCINTGFRFYQHYDTHFPEETRQLFTGTSVLFAAVLWFSVGRRRRSKSKGSNPPSQQQQQNIFINIAGGPSYRFNHVGAISSVSDRNLVWAEFVKAMNSSVAIPPTEVPAILEAFETSSTLTKTRENLGFLKSLMSKAKSLTGYTQLKRAVLTLDVAKSDQAAAIQAAVDDVMSMPTAFTSQALRRVLQKTRDSYHLSLVPEGGKQFILSLLNVGPLRKMSKKAQLLAFVRNSPHDDANVIARALLKSFRFHDHKPDLQRIPLSSQLLQQVDSVQGVPKTTMIFSNGKTAPAILDCGSVKPFISRNLLETIDGIISQSVNQPVKKIITTTGSKLVPNEVIRIQFHLPAVDKTQLFVEEFDIVPSDNLLALGAEFLKKANINPMAFIDPHSSKHQSRVSRLIAKYVTPFLFSEPVFLPPHSSYDYDLKLKDSFDKIRPRPLIKPKNFEEE